MSAIRLHDWRARATLALWLGLGLIGVVIALAAIVSIAASHGLLPRQLLLGSGQLGQAFVEFIAGISLACMALWVIYLKVIEPSAV